MFRKTHLPPVPKQLVAICRPTILTFPSQRTDRGGESHLYNPHRHLCLWALTAKMANFLLATGKAADTHAKYDLEDAENARRTCHYLFSRPKVQCATHIMLITLMYYQERTYHHLHTICNSITQHVAIISCNCADEKAIVNQRQRLHFNNLLD